MEFIKFLTRQGATIEELNLIRSQLSKVKGGKLLEAANEANFIHTFILSGNDFYWMITLTNEISGTKLTNEISRNRYNWKSCRFDWLWANNKTNQSESFKSYLKV